MEPSSVYSYSTPSPVRKIPTDVSYSTPPPAPIRKYNTEDSYSTPPASIRKRQAEDSFSTPLAAMRKCPAEDSYSTPPAPKKKRPAELTPNELVKMFLNSSDEVYLSTMEQLLALYVIPEDEVAKRQRQMQSNNHGSFRLDDMPIPHVMTLATFKGKRNNAGKRSVAGKERSLSAFIVSSAKNSSKPVKVIKQEKI